MTKGILGRKIGMTQVFAENGDLIPVTVIEAAPNVVLQKKTNETDGYESIQLGFEDKREKLSNKPEKGHVAKAETAPKRFIREFRELDVNGYEVGQEVKVDTFAEGDIVDITGTSKGKGFQGVIKRHGYSRGPMVTVHVSTARQVQSVPLMHNVYSKVKKCQVVWAVKLVTIQNLEIVRVDAERNLLLVKGNVPGARKSLITVRSAIKGN